MGRIKLRVHETYVSLSHSYNGFNFTIISHFTSFSSSTVLFFFLCLYLRHFRPVEIIKHHEHCTYIHVNTIERLMSTSMLAFFVRNVPYFSSGVLMDQLNGNTLICDILDYLTVLDL